MKQIIIIGATGSLAKYVIEDIKKVENVALTLFARHIKGLPEELRDGCHLIQGDAAIYQNVRSAIKGKEIVYINLAGNLEVMVENITKAMLEADVKRLIAISSIGIYKEPLKNVLIPYRRLADLIELSGLDYTILRPDWFTDIDEIDYVLSKKGEPEIGTAVSRKSIAAFIKTIVENPQRYKHENLGISKPHRIIRGRERFIGSDLGDISEKQ